MPLRLVLPGERLSSWLRYFLALGGKIKEVIEFVFRESPHHPNNELLTDVALAFSHPVNLAYRYLHSLGSLRFNGTGGMPLARLQLRYHTGGGGFRGTLNP